MIIFFGGFSIIMVYNELTREGFQRGSINIRNRLSMETFYHVTNGVRFHIDYTNERPDMYFYEWVLRPVPTFDGTNFEYYLELNGNVVFDAVIGERFVTATVPFSFYYIDGSHLVTANLEIRILFWEDRTNLRLTVHGSQEARFLHRHFEASALRIFVNEVVRRST